MNSDSPSESSKKTHRLISTRLAPPAEMMRWLFSYYKIPYHEDAHAPGFHVITTRLLKLPQELPVVIAADGTPWCGIKGCLSELDRITPGDEKLLGNTPETRDRNWALINKFYEYLFWPAVQTYYYHMLDKKKLVIPAAIDHAPGWEKLFVEWLYPLWKPVMVSGLGLKTYRVDEATLSINKAFDAVVAELSGQEFLNGDRPGPMDIIFSSLAAPVVFPDKFGAMLPLFNSLPEAFQSSINKNREHPAGQLVLAAYERCR